jgi:poly(3-hydroxybutyrate) depolymerase
MKKWRCLLFLIILLAGTATGAQLQRIPGPAANPGNLRMYVYIPDGLDSSRTYPLILVLHGSMLNARTMHHCGGWGDIADSLKFFILYPEQRFVNNPVRAFNVLFGSRKNRLQREAASVRNMIAYMETVYGADAEQCYITGFSAGGSMANALLHIYPEQFRAAALLAAPGYLPPQITGKMRDIPRLAIIQGNADPVVTPDNAKEILNTWLQKYPTASLQTRIHYPYMNNPNLRAHIFRYENDVVLLRLDMAGVSHQMPVDPGPEFPQGGRHSLYSVDIDFYLNWWIAGFFLRQLD